jgi:hypothetical protein
MHTGQITLKKDTTRIHGVNGIIILKWVLQKMECGLYLSGSDYLRQKYFSQSCFDM